MSKANGVPHDVTDINLASTGADMIEWADASMPVLATIRRRFETERPLDGIRVSACLHVTTETANLARTLAAGGAEVSVCASNPLSTQDEVAASLVTDHGIPVFARNGEDNDTYSGHIGTVLDAKPQITMDDGADLVGTIHSSREELIAGIIGGTEETTTGVIRLRAMQKAGVLEYPIMAVNEADTKHFFDNRYGTGQSTIDGILRATNLLLAGKNFVVCGYGWCGRGLASRARGMGANVITTEIDATRALEALMDGFRVMPIAEAAEIGDIFVTVTGNKNVIDKSHFLTMKSGAVLANSGHFDVEINIAELERLSTSRRKIRPMLEEFVMPDGRKVYLLGEGRLINLASAEGHPASVMDMSFANQALAAEYMVKNADSLEKQVYPVPQAIDQEIARLKLDSMGIKVDSLTEEQATYLGAWQEGT
jgi:adenosylhomocysteinase